MLQWSVETERGRERVRIYSDRCERGESEISKGKKIMKGPRIENRYQPSVLNYKLERVRHPSPNVPAGPLWPS